MRKKGLRRLLPAAAAVLLAAGMGSLCAAEQAESVVPDEVESDVKQDSDAAVQAEYGASDEAEGDAEQESSAADAGADWCGLAWDHSMELAYAKQFAVDYYEGGYIRVRIPETEECFLVVPEDGEVPKELEKNVTVLRKPVQNIYLVATSAMDLFCSLDELDSIRLSGTKADGWCMEEAQAAMESGDILYAGKYSAPDYEQILAENCGLAVESTMIYHNPEVKEKLESFGIPVLVERSSYEPHPLGRTEWIRLYAALLGCEEKADAIFARQIARMEEISSSGSTGKTVAFFYIGSNGYASVRKPGDYVPKMIEMAGGKYIFDSMGNEEDNALSTVNMTLEEFYAQAKDADVIIYNSTIDGELYTIEELLSKSALLADFKAVKDGNVWCTGKNLFQETTCLGDMIADIHTVLADEEAADEELTFLHRLTAQK